jgi:membrane protease subunit (stomatin/prohibitin family)
MALTEFIGKQFIDVIEWLETDDGTLAWRVPMAGHEIQHGAALTVRESQVAIFVDEGRVADVFGPGRHRLTTQTLPVLTTSGTGTSCSRARSRATSTSSARASSSTAAGARRSR